MNTHDNDCIIAIKNYEDIVLSLPILEENILLEDLPELHKIFLTICILLRDYDKDLVNLIEEKWDNIGNEEKDILLRGSTETKVISDAVDNIKDMLDNTNSSIKVRKTDPARSIRG